MELIIRDENKKNYEINIRDTDGLEYYYEYKNVNIVKAIMLAAEEFYNNESATPTAIMIEEVK